MKKPRKLLDFFIERDASPNQSMNYDNDIDMNIDISQQLDMDMSAYEYEDLLSPEALEDITLPTSIDSQLINHVYFENGLSDFAKSIFKVEDFLNTLPTEMPNEVKRTTVLGILQASGINITDVYHDAHKRIDILESVNLKVSYEVMEKVDHASAEIEALKAQIDDLNKIIYEANNETAQTNELIKQEINRIKSLETFIKIEGGN